MKSFLIAIAAFAIGCDCPPPVVAPTPEISVWDAAFIVRVHLAERAKCRPNLEPALLHPGEGFLNDPARWSHCLLLIDRLPCESIPEWSRAGDCIGALDAAPVRQQAPTAAKDTTR